MTYYLAIQNTYTHVQMALYANDLELNFVEIDKTKASRECIITVQQLLQKHNLVLKDLAFIAVNQGPGPFTTLRVVIATINGLAFSSQIPLIGINAVEAFLQECQHHNKNLAVLMNAFGNDAYYGIQINNSYDSGCESIEAILLKINQKIAHEKILLIGNGVELFVMSIKNTIGDRATFLDPNPQTVSLKQIAKIAFKKWESQTDLSFQLQPLYFKSAFYQNSTSTK